jgi:hypothetical protein
VTHLVLLGVWPFVRPYETSECHDRISPWQCRGSHLPCDSCHKVVAVPSRPQLAAVDETRPAWVPRCETAQDTAGLRRRQCAMTAAVSAGPCAGRGGCSSCSGAKAGTVSGPEQRALAAINGLPDFLFWAPDERPAEAS